MRFAYMVQSEGALPPAFEELRQGGHRHLYHLTFREPAPGAIHLPSSTWTEGRNRLLAEARASGEAFDYFIFSDDDVQFKAGSWREFEDQLVRHRPPIGVPALLPAFHGRVHAVYDFDAIVNAFHRDLIEDEIVLPYISAYDSTTWWLSQYFVIHFAGALYANAVVKFPEIVIDNLAHRDYPRISAAKFVDFDEIYFSLWADQEWARRHFRTHFSTRNDPPFSPVRAPSYRLTSHMREKLLPRLADIRR